MKVMSLHQQLAGFSLVPGNVAHSPPPIVHELLANSLIFKRKPTENQVRGCLSCPGRVPTPTSNLSQFLVVFSSLTGLAIA